MKRLTPRLRVICVAIFYTLLPAFSFAQSCGDLWYDEIGPIGHYQPGVFQEGYFCPDTPEGKVNLVFTDVDLPADTEDNCTYYFIFYDGPNESSPVLAFYCGTTLIESNGNAPDSVLSEGDILSATSESGCISAIFWSSDAGQVEYTGWQLYIDCVPPVNCPTPTIDATTELDCENMQYYTRLMVEDAPTADSIPNLMVEYPDPGIFPVIKDTVLPNIVGGSVLLGPFASQTLEVFTISTPGYSCPATVYTQETCPPLNDNCSNAYILTNSELVEGTLTGSDDGAVCFSYTAEETTMVGAYMCSGYTDIEAYLTISYDDPTIIDEGFVDCDGLTLPYVEFIAEAGKTYWITLSGHAPPWLGSSMLMYSIAFSMSPLECDYPDLSLSVVDELGNPLYCSPTGSEIYVAATLTNAAENTDYVLSTGDMNEMMQNNTTTLLGPFSAGPQLSFILSEAENSWCFITESLPTVCLTSLTVSTNPPMSCTGRPIILRMYPPDSQSPAYTISQPLNESGEVEFTGIPSGTFDLYLKPSGYLQVFLGNSELLPEDNFLTISEVYSAGDINGDNGINIADASAISNAFNAGESDPNYVLQADFNCDSYISILDFSAIIPGFNTTGAVPPPN